MRIVTAFSLLVLAGHLSVPAQDYTVDSSKIAGGGETSQGGTFSVTGTIGQADATSPLRGGSYSLAGGFWSLIAVVQTAGAPRLAIARSGTSTIIAWPASDQTFVLQENNSLIATNWFNYSGTLTTEGTNQSATISSSFGNKFFRLISR